MKKGYTIHRATEKDYDFILRLNRENVEVLAPMDLDRLLYFERVTELLWVAEADGKPAAFLIAMREGVSDYDSENYRWFSERYPCFLYVDRIVLDSFARGKGLGSFLYQQVFEHAAGEGIPVVLAEIDTVPYNAASLGFHRQMGFRQVGTQAVRKGTVEVSLQERLIAEK